MTIKTDGPGGTYVIHCDECPEDIQTEQDQFDRARNMAARAGWRGFKGPDDKWANACPACVETYRHSKRGKRS